MRKINYNLKSEDIENYYLEITKDRDSRYLLSNKVSNIDKFLKTLDKSFSFEEIILADFIRLLDYINSIENHIEQVIKPKILANYKDDEKKYVEDFFKIRYDKEYKSQIRINKKKKEEISKVINKKVCSIFPKIETILYENGTISNCISDFFMKHSEELNIKTCYYCNIDFVNVFEKNTKNHFTLDHILPKSKYPYLSISLFNLIPSCYSCNSKFKRNKEFKDLEFIHKISPSSKTFELDKLLKFKLNFDVNTIGFENSISKIKLIDDVKAKLTNLTSEKEVDIFIDMFSLKGRYEFHNGLAEEMVNKRKKYSDTQINEIVKIFKKNGILIDKESFKKDIFGSMIFEKEDSNEPFEKYKKDIAKQLGLLD
ncbi:HNH endonuclease [Flavobacterium sp.]|uniref:HNH endonuclease n=1 Tax=Flavobacterium sp. TaxID=239 RepID=UPI004048CEAF